MPPPPRHPGKRTQKSGGALRSPTRPSGGQAIGSEQRMEALLAETEAELAKIQPQIEKLERQMDKLRELRQTKQKLITLKLSLQSIIENFGADATTPLALPLDHACGAEGALPGAYAAGFAPYAGYTPQVGGYFPMASRNPLLEEVAGKIFLPDQAFAQVGELLRKRNSLNTELFRAVVFNGGKATTEQIKDYLVTHRVTLPSTGQPFDEAPLSDISSRANYLVRKGILKADGRGHFLSLLGWVEQ